ncbi:MAG: SDR family oxidoreductase [Rhodospirillales bacterium]|nr:SDR family oxidoreductase [Rhodospirillales bacterium]
MSGAAGVVVVTGAGRGIGAATARAVAARGYGVIVNYRADGKTAAATVKAIRDAGGQAEAVAADVGVPADVERLFVAADRLGRLAGLVNNAGINGGAGAFADMPDAAAARVFATNVLGAMACARQAIARMSRSRSGAGGAIVNVSSQAALFGGNRLTAYAASKAALNTFTVGLAREVAGEGIRVNAVSPGVIATDMHAGDSPERQAQLAAGLPMGRPGTPEEVAATIVWLLADAPAYLTGAVIPLTGGR